MSCPSRSQSVASQNSFGRAQCLSNGFELRGFVAALGRASSVKAFGPQKDW